MGVRSSASKSVSGLDCLSCLTQWSCSKSSTKKCLAAFAALATRPLKNAWHAAGKIEEFFDVLYVALIRGKTKTSHPSQIGLNGLRPTLRHIPENIDRHSHSWRGAKQYAREHAQSGNRQNLVDDQSSGSEVDQFESWSLV